MLRAIMLLAFAAVASAGTVVRAQSIDIEGSSQEIAIHVAGMQACKLDGVLPIDAINAYAGALKKFDETAFLRGAQKGVLVVKGLDLKAGSAGCKTVKQELLKVAKDYAEIGDKLKK